MGTIISKYTSLSNIDVGIVNDPRAPWISMVMNFLMHFINFPKLYVNLIAPPLPGVLHAHTDKVTSMTNYEGAIHNNDTNKM